MMNGVLAARGIAMPMRDEMSFLAAKNKTHSLPKHPFQMIYACSIRAHYHQLHDLITTDQSRSHKFSLIQTSKRPHASI